MAYDPQSLRQQLQTLPQANVFMYNLIHHEVPQILGLRDPDSSATRETSRRLKEQYSNQINSIIQGLVNGTRRQEELEWDTLPESVMDERHTYAGRNEEDSELNARRRYIISIIEALREKERLLNQWYSNTMDAAGQESNYFYGNQRKGGKGRKSRKKGNRRKGSNRKGGRKSRK